MPNQSSKNLAAAQKRVAAGGRGVPGLKAAAAKLPKRKAVDTSSPALKTAQRRVASGKTGVAWPKPAAKKAGK
jgi:hypothetical protein